jgi:predicted PurR-regulated permease PerM
MGICAVTVLTAVAVVVVGMFRINKTNKELNDLVRNQDTMDRIIVDNEREIRRTIDSRIDRFGSNIEKEIKFLHERIDGLNKVK